LNINEKTKAGFNALYAQREQIEKEFGSPLLWNELPTKIMSTIGITKDNADIMNEDDWENQFAWLVDKLEKLDKVFRRRVRELPGNE
jgi:hypothetical protein